MAFIWKEIILTFQLPNCTSRRIDNRSNNFGTKLNFTIIMCVMKQMYTSRTMSF